MIKHHHIAMIDSVRSSVSISSELLNLSDPTFYLHSFHLVLTTTFLIMTKTYFLFNFLFFLLNIKIFLSTYYQVLTVCGAIPSLPGLSICIF